MLSFIHAADIHLDSPLKGLVEYEGAPSPGEIRAATRQALENLVSLTLSENIPLLIISGDIYDGDWKDFNTGLFFARQMQRLKDGGVKVAMVRGNHDAENTMTRTLVLPENVKIFNSIKPETWALPDLDVALHGQSYHTREVYDNLAVHFPDPVPGLFNIGVLHCLISGMKDYAPYAPCSIDDLAAKGYDYWALGHVHEHNVLRQSPAVVYAGCTQARHIREQGPRGCVLVELDRQGERATTNFIPLDAVRWMELEVDVSQAESIEQAAFKFGEALSGQVSGTEGRVICIRAILTGQTPLHGIFSINPDSVTANIRAVAADITKGRALIEKVHNKTGSMMDLKALSQTDTPQGELVRYLDGITESDQNLEALGLDLTSLKSKLAGTGLEIPEESFADCLSDARDILLNLLADEENTGEVP